MLVVLEREIGFRSIPLNIRSQGHVLSTKVGWMSLETENVSLSFRSNASCLGVTYNDEFLLFALSRSGGVSTQLALDPGAGCFDLVHGRDLEVFEGRHCVVR